MVEIDRSRFVAAALEEAPDTEPVAEPPLRGFGWLKSSLGLGLPARRERVGNPAAPPYSAVALLNFYNPGFFGRGTGFFVKQNLIVTAAHSFDMARPTAIAVYPGYDARRNAVLRVSGLAWAWDGARDLGVIVMPDHSSHFGIRPPPGNDVAVAGYAFSYAGGKAQMTVGTGPCQIENGTLTYAIPVREGDSGAPVIIYEGAGAVGVHSGLALDNPARGRGEPVDDDFVELVDALEEAATARLPRG